MPDEQKQPYIKVTIYCSRCGQQQVVHVLAVLGGVQVDRQTICCIKCKQDFDAHVPGEIIGGPFLP